MQHFLVELTYTVPGEQLDPVVPAHRAFLQTGYDKGLLLLSGPQEPRTGGVVIARAESRAVIEEFFKGDPYAARGLATYRFVQFTPVKHRGFLTEWVRGE